MVIESEVRDSAAGPAHDILGLPTPGQRVVAQPGVARREVGLNRGERREHHNDNDRTDECPNEYDHESPAHARTSGSRVADGKAWSAWRRYYGRRGELRQRYREGQEDQLGALGLVVNAVVLWNTRYMQRALDQLEESGETIRPEDVERLSPLGYEHVNLLGRYTFSLAEALARGELRPLRNPADPEEQNDLLG